MNDSTNLTDQELAATLAALRRVHEPVAVPLPEMPVFLAAYNKLAKQQQVRAANAQAAGLAKILGKNQATPSDEAPPEREPSTDVDGGTRKTL